MSFALFDRDNIDSLATNLALYPEGLVVVIDKPYRWTSADAVRKIKFVAKRAFGERGIKVGHAGTLDPLATGILIICIGKATKASEQLQAEEKEYIADIRLGATTPSFDLEKEVDFHYPYEHITRALIEDRIPTLLGEQDQIPPKFSAKFINGVRAYEMARAGEEVEMRPARIRIDAIDILEFENPCLKVNIKCSKGTYIRSLARDIGAVLESGGHLTGLRRTRSGSFLIEKAVPLEKFIEILKNN
ncbi:MAG: tRNA pseudouridine(55) synthase TruB [Candidatus Egerieousia sp.]|nr:tRNA pseudouridine(55) synthase TruB [Candidatus Egerieousia sp.]